MKLRCGNIDNEEDSSDIFDHAPALTREVIDDFRNEFNTLETAYHNETRYLKKHRDKKFILSEELSLTFTGLKLNEVHEIHDKYLKEYDGYFRQFDSLEMFNALLCTVQKYKISNRKLAIDYFLFMNHEKIQIRTGLSVNFVQKLYILRTGHSIDINQLRANIKKILFFLGKYFLLEFFCTN